VDETLIRQYSFYSMDPQKLKSRVAALPVVGPKAIATRNLLAHRRFIGSGSYWEQRYASGGNSGAGSYGRLAEAKAAVLNRLVADQRIGSVLEIGCGDGNQVELAHYPAYVGIDVSPSVIAACHQRFIGDPTKRFLVSGEDLPRCELV
jgi:SAM-dependent methyltransferase